MQLGLGLYRHMLTRENFQFARQAGATHIVIHLVDYFKDGTHNPRDNQPTGTDQGWGLAGDPNQLWTLEELTAIRKAIEAEGLVWEAIENFDPAHWHDILLDGPQKLAQMEGLKRTIQTIGRVGIPIMGYNFSLAGVWGWTKMPVGRGGAKALVSDEAKNEPQTPMPNGMVWNMVYDPHAPAGVVPHTGPEEL